MKTRNLRQAFAFPIAPDVVSDCLDLDAPADAMFHQAWTRGLAALPSASRRGALNVATGHIAESVCAVALGDLGYNVVSQLTGPGGHGVDLLILAPDGNTLVAVEVKGTLQPNRIPRLSRRTLDQMSAKWVDKDDNPGMATWDLQSGDVYGAVVVVNFGDMTFRVGFTLDYERLVPVTAEEQLLSLDWLEG